VNISEVSVGVPEPSCLTSVAAFHSLFYGPVAGDYPCIPPARSCSLQVALLQEELDELKQAIKTKDIVAAADAFADFQYVLSWSVQEFGLHHRFDSIFAEVHRSNLSKACKTKDEAEATVQHYARSKHVQSEIKESAFAPGKFLVNRIPDKKVLKSVNYSPPQLHDLVHRRTTEQGKESETPEKLTLKRAAEACDQNDASRKNVRVSAPTASV